MAYTRPWTEVMNLLGSRDADEIDNAAREDKLDLTERFSDIVKDVNADPWELKTTGVGEDGLMIFTLSGLTGVPTLETDVDYSGFTALPGVAGAAGAVGLAFPLILPVGARLTMVTLVGYRTHTGAEVSLSVVEANYAAETSASLEVLTLPVASADLQTVESTFASFVVEENKSYFASAFVKADASGVATARLAAVGYKYKAIGVE